ncbi:PIF1-like helicase-domain-containing protein, partial [Rhodofomes roseus]
MSLLALHKTTEDTNVFPDEEADLRIPQLNVDQRHAFSRIIDSVTAQQGSIFFLNGPGGTGKTFVYNTVCHKVRAEGWIVLCVASSGIASLLLKGGRTAHSRLKIPVENLNAQSTCAIRKE